MALERTLPTLIVKVEGSVLETNIDIYRSTALEFVETINTVLNTDDDFAEAEGIVKWCGDAEKKIKSVKAQAMEQAADINAVFAALDDVSAALRDKRLALNKQVKAQKDERKQEALDNAMANLVAHIAELESDLQTFKLPTPKPYAAEFLSAAKGKKTLKGLNKSLDKALAAAKAEYATTHTNVRKNEATLRAHKEHAFLFADAQEHATKPAAEFKTIVETRIADHNEAEKTRLEREREKMREEVREQERAQMEAEVAAAAQKAVDAATRDQVAVQLQPAPGAAAGDDPHVHHMIDYVEIGAVDLAAAKAFYGAAFGWRFVDHGPESAGIVGDGPERGGLCKVDSVATGGIWIVLYSDDLDETAAAIVQAGGRVTKGPFEFSGGRQLHFSDPSGNEMAVWSVK